MKGDTVIIRLFRGVPAVRRIWEDGTSVFYITDDMNFEKLLRGEEALQPIGFPKEDVFVAQNEFMDLIKKYQETEEWDWECLIPYFASR